MNIKIKSSGCFIIENGDCKLICERDHPSQDWHYILLNEETGKFQGNRIINSAFTDIQYAINYVTTLL